MGKKKTRTSGARRRLLTSVGLARSDPGRFLKFARDAFLRIRVCEMIRDGGKITAGGVETRVRRGKQKCARAVSDALEVGAARLKLHFNGISFPRSIQNQKILIIVI